jgi:hypothetical protein
VKYILIHPDTLLSKQALSGMVIYSIYCPVNAYVVEMKAFLLFHVYLLGVMQASLQLARKQSSLSTSVLDIWV